MYAYSNFDVLTEGIKSLTFAAVTKTIKNMYSSSDFERLFIRYKAEAMPEGESIQAFCLKNKVPYNLFHKWYKYTQHQMSQQLITRCCQLAV